MTKNVRSFAIIPAAGKSDRMGLPKLLLPYGRWTVIESVLAAWQASCVDAIVVVVRSGDTNLQSICQRSVGQVSNLSENSSETSTSTTRCPISSQVSNLSEDRLETCPTRRVIVDVVLPLQDPPDMRASVQYALAHLATHYQPEDTDRWLLAPADMPGLSTAAINRVLRAGQDCRDVCIPTYQGKRGHPVSFPWRLAPEVFRLSQGQGVNALTHRFAVMCLAVEEPSILVDVDTPADYARVQWTSGDESSKI